MKKLKCYACDGIFDENELIYCKDPDELMCPLCHAREDGFSEVEGSGADMRGEEDA